MRKFVAALAVLGVSLLSACGGAELGSTDSGSGSNPDPEPQAPKAQTVVLLASSVQLPSDASAVASGVTLTAIVRDSSNRVMANVPVAFSAAGSAELNVSTTATTDTNGRVEAVLTTGGDPRNRDIEVAAVADGLTATQTIAVVGTTLNLTGPDSAQVGSAQTYSVQLTDAAGNGIPNQQVTAVATAGATVSPSSKQTNSSGIATFSVTPGAGNTELTVQTLGLSASKDITTSLDQLSFINPTNDGVPVPIETDRAIQVQWLRNGVAVPNAIVEFQATRGVIASPATVTTNAQGIASATIRAAQAGPTTISANTVAFDKPSATRKLEFVATTPAKISVQAFPANLSVNQTSDVTVIIRDAHDNPVKNAVIDFSLFDATAGSLSSASAVTNSLGVATVTYAATSLVSATDGVQITGTVRGTAIKGTALLTVGGRAVNITLGTGNLIVVKDESTYQDMWTVLVNDPSGNPVPDADFTLSVRSLQYVVGYREMPDVEMPAPSWVCENEDVNQNDFLDAGEDVNQNGELDPGRPASVPNTVTLDDEGTGQFAVTYPKEYGDFVRVELVATARVAGSETTETRRFWLRIVEGDEDHLPNISPFGAVAADEEPNCVLAN